jgi:hypothetical protein
MLNVAPGKRILAIAALACLCATLVAVPANALYYVHGEEGTAQTGSTGVIEVCCTIDATAIDEGVRTALLVLPADSTAAACLDGAIRSGNSQNGLEAIHDYGYTGLGDYLSGKTWTCSVYGAASQGPGTQTAYDTDGTLGQDIPLSRYDSVVFTVE